MISIVCLGDNPRLRQALTAVPAQTLDPAADLRGRRLVFAVAVDDGGPAPEYYAFLRRLRTEPECLKDAVAVMVVDGTSELYTKSAANALALAASMAGCTLPGRALVEATGSLYNQHIQARNRGLSLEETYYVRIRELCSDLETFVLPKRRKPKVLLIHASEQRNSNTLALGRQVAQRLADVCQVREIGLLNGTVQDCRGCGYRQCLHFSQNNTCFYGGALSDEVMPAIADSDVLLFLCPNYNDALGANLTALINRMSGLVLQQSLQEKLLAAVVVSGYSGGDLVAQQLLGAMCLNRGVIVPPHFCLLQTAHYPGDAMAAAGIGERLDRFAACLRKNLGVEEIREKN